MQSLHEYMMSTKAVEYLLAVAFLVGFILFWLFMSQKQKGDRHRSDCKP